MFIKYDKLYEVKNKYYNYYSFVDMNKINTYLNIEKHSFTNDFYPFFTLKLDIEISQYNMEIKFGGSTVVYKSTYKEKIDSKGIFPYIGKKSNPEILIYNLQDKEKCEKLLYRLNNYLDYHLIENEIDKIEETKRLDNRLNSVI